MSVSPEMAAPLKEVAGGTAARRIMVVAGEPSGDEHLAGVVESLEAHHPGRALEWFGSGGDACLGRGVRLLEHVDALAAIGPTAALGNARAYWRLFRRLLAEARQQSPDLALLVDFPEFNLRLASRLRRLGIPVCYFIGPQVWAWRAGRVKSIRRSVDRMLVILPFEEDYYRRRGVECHFVGHPLGRWRNPQPPSEGLSSPARVGLLPGSREREVQLILPSMLGAARLAARRHDCRFLLLRAAGIHPDRLQSRLQEAGVEVEVAEGSPREFLSSLDCALIKSGTSTLQAMALAVPFVMVYRVSGWSYRLLRPWVGTDTYCLANLVAGERVVPELVQEEARPERLAEALLKLLGSESHLNRMKHNLWTASERLGHEDTYSNVALHLSEMLWT